MEPNNQGFPKVRTLNTALKLAEAWVDNMKGGTTSDPRDLEVEGRPQRLGLGAKAAPKVKPAYSTDPVEINLLGRLRAQKKLSEENIEKTSSATGNVSDEDGEDETESRTSAFTKKRLLSSSIPLPSMKKRR